MTRQELELLGAQVASEIGANLDDEREDKRPPRDHSKTNWASEIGHPCKKHLVHCRLDWREKKPMDLDGGYRVEEGNRAEWWMKKALGDVGFEIQGTQEYFRIPDAEIAGKIDGRLPLKRQIPGFPDKRTVACEIKSINPRYWDTVRTVEDMAGHRSWWIRGYPSQLNSALFYFKDPFGFFILTTFGKRPRILPVIFDEARMEGDLAKAYDVNAHAAAGTYPEPIPYDPQICGMCDFAHLCQPPRATEMREIPAGEVPILHQYVELEEWHERYLEARATLIGTAEKPGRYYGANAIVEDIQISSATQRRTFYPGVPEETKKEIKKLQEPYAEKRELTITTIERIGQR
ncbi:MAG: hypothetical protein A2Y86_05240 [Candidatus Aminicenantes bacterium RBG_13_62_12]|nr:MAG: hypothetical protein A2Y86_05240 [Candidatus Aminicenantes bacterium RBG_13_62_12]